MARRRLTGKGRAVEFNGLDVQSLVRTHSGQADLLLRTGCLQFATEIVRKLAFEIEELSGLHNPLFTILVQLGEVFG